MPDIDDFKNAVLVACRSFWTQDWPNLENFLHYHVVMKRIDDPEAFHQGKHDVVDYFYNNGQTDRARFEFDPDDANKTSWQIVEDGNGMARVGIVSGSGRFWPTYDAPHPRPVAFSFSFLKVNQNWLAIQLWGAYTDN